MTSSFSQKYLPSKSNAMGWWLVVITSITAFFWAINTPLYVDDFMYEYVLQHSKDFGDIPTTGEYNLPFYKIPYAIYFHAVKMNGRFANYAMLFSVPFPVWLVKMFLGTALASLYLLLIRWIRPGRITNNLAVLISPVALWYGLPWNVFMQSSDYQFNYILPSVLMVACIILFYRERCIKWWAWLLLFFFSLWHEGFTVVFGAFTATFYLLTREKKYLYMLFVLMAGFLLQMTPGTVERILYTSENAAGKENEFVSGIRELWPSVTALVLWLFLRKKQNPENRKFTDVFIVALLVSWLAVLVIIIATNAPQRAHWPNNLLALCLIFFLLGKYKLKNIRPVIASVVIAVCVAWSASLVYYQHRSKEITDYSVDQIMNGETVFKDKYGVGNLEIPFWLKHIVSIPYGTFRFFESYILADISSNVRNHGFIMPPDSLLGKPVEEWPKMPGNNNFYYIEPSIVVGKNLPENCVEDTYEVTFDKPVAVAHPVSYLIYLITGSPEKHELKTSQISKIVYNGDTIILQYLGWENTELDGRKILKMNKLTSQE